jgi:mannose-6-phosphate isomerase
MANSDNVIRGGLTQKHVDIDELIHILSFTEDDVQILNPKKSISGEDCYPLDVDEFALSRISIAPGASYASPEKQGVEILLCTDGSAVILYDGFKGRLAIEKGGSILIPASMASYQIIGNATIYKAGTPKKFLDSI